MPTVHEKITRYGTTQIDYEALLARYPWLVQRDNDCILSPDSDGLLCGLFLSHYLNWKIRGFYDGKLMVIEKGYSAKNCVFLDMEIFRRDVRSVGQHMLLYNKNTIPENWNNFDNCFAPNNIRGYDACHDFRLKYPFGTIHLLIPILGTTQTIPIPTTAITPLLFTDGTWMNLLQYTENSLSWINFLRANDVDNPLHAIFLNDHYSLHALMVAMDEFLRKRDAISIPRERGDRIAITLRGGEGTPHNLESDGETYFFKEDAKKRGESFIRLLAELTKWDYNPANWSWRNWQLHKFTKGDFANSRLNGETFDALVRRDPLSFAITSTQNLEYTIEEPDRLPWL
jgi:hypothetical protein